MSQHLLRSHARIFREFAVGVLVAFGGELPKICMSEGRMTVMVCSCTPYRQKNQ